MKFFKKILILLIITILACSYSYAATPSNTDRQSTVVEEEIEQNHSTSIIRNNHPRKDGLWIQYYPLNTALRKNFVFSDVIAPDSTWENYAGAPINTHTSENETPENYDDSHNHYQNILSEVLNFKANANAVSIWGDSYAVADKSKAWGGFFSARSGQDLFADGQPFNQYVPEGYQSAADASTYDAQLTGVEIDVLNDGLPGVYPNMSKTGLQIVGFGNPNSMAIEIRCEDTDKKEVSPSERKGVWETGIYFKNSLAPYGRVLVTDFEQAKMGLDFRNTLFTEGAFNFKTQQVGSGIILNNGDSGEIYGGQRWEGTDDPNDWLTLRAGNGGIRIVSQDNTRELVAIDNYGGIYLNGDVYLNGEKINAPTNSNYIFFLMLCLAWIIATLYLLCKVKKLSAQVDSSS